MPSRLLALHLTLAASLLISNATAQLGGSAGIGSGSGVRRGVQQNPLSAEFVDERSTVLADGNRIDQEMHEKFYRDSEGRTRTEHEIFLPNGQRHQTVMITDLVKGINIFLDPDRKTAQVHQYPLQPFAVNAAPRRPVPLQRRSEDAPKFENLGHMTIEGVDAVGSRTIWTTPANTIGNSQPIIRVNETWLSQELRIAVLTKYFDPRSGENTHKLTSLLRNEPDPALFQIPSDYTVTQVSETLPPPQR